MQVQIIVYSPDDTPKQHFEDLEQLFDRLRLYNVKLKPAKCFFAQKSMPYLGHIISRNGIEMSQDKISAIVKAKPPKMLTELHSFLGACGYYRKFVKDFSKITWPLNQLLQKNKDYEWSTECDEAFQTMKDKLTSSPILVYPQMDKPFIVHSDASNRSIGAVLSQKDDDGLEHVISYASKALDKHEKNYPITEKEMLGAIYAAKQFRQYLYGQKWTLVTDHIALQYSIFNLKGRLLHWSMLLADHDVTIMYRPGKKHQNADYLSRIAHEKESVEPITKGNILPVGAITLTAQDSEELQQIEEKQRQEKEWTALIQYLEDRTLPDSPIETNHILHIAANYEIING